MKKFVLDASVAAKWFLPASGEPLAEEALDLLNRYARDQLALLIPDLFWPEVGNLLWEAVRLRRIPRDSAEQAILRLREILPSTFSTRLLIEDAFAIATAFNQTVYDSSYVALAVAREAPLLTADERLLNALGPWFPMQWLGSL